MVDTNYNHLETEEVSNMEPVSPLDQLGGSFQNETKENNLMIRVVTENPYNEES